MSPLIRTLIWISACLSLSGCIAIQETAREDFFAPEAGSATPWTDKQFDDGAGKFTFAVIGDLYSGEPQAVFERAISGLNLLRPEFIISVGDLIDGNSEDAEYLNRQWDGFDAWAGRARAPFFHVGGNHDLTNVSMRQVWEDRYGPRYYHFLYKDVLFLVLDTEDYPQHKLQHIYRIRAEYIEAMDAEAGGLAEMPYAVLPERSTGEIGREQSTYFENVLAQNAGVRWTFVLMHKPAWLREDEFGLGRIEQALQGRPYTVLNGHLHRYSYRQEFGRDYIMLGTTGGYRAMDGSAGAFDHVMLVTMDNDEPSIANLLVDGVLDKSGERGR